MRKETCIVILLLFAGLVISGVSCNEPNAPKGENNQTVNSPQSEPKTAPQTEPEEISQPDKEESSTDVISEPEAVSQPKEEPSSTSFTLT